MKGRTTVRAIMGVRSSSYASGYLIWNQLLLTEELVDGMYPQRKQCLPRQHLDGIWQLNRGLDEAFDSFNTQESQFLEIYPSAHLPSLTLDSR